MERAWEVEPNGFYPNSAFPLFLVNSGWKCSKCDMRENLWLNMTDGAILCGRRYFDGSGGNNHAVEHYRETGYPLAVKLGTITPDGAGEKGGSSKGYRCQALLRTTLVSDRVKEGGFQG